MKPDKQQLAKDLYLQTDKTQQEIADILDVNRRTVYLWMKHGKWEEIKNASWQAPSAIRQDIYNHISAVNKKIYQRAPEDRCPTMEEVEKLRKLVGITRIIPGYSSGTYIQIFEQLIRYTKKKDLALGQNIAKMANTMLKATILDNFHGVDLEMQYVEEQIKRVEDEDAAFAKSYPLNNETPPALSEIYATHVTSPSPSENDSTHVTSPSPSERAGERSHATP